MAFLQTLIFLKTTRGNQSSKTFGCQASFTKKRIAEGREAVVKRSSKKEDSASGSEANEESTSVAAAIEEANEAPVDPPKWKSKKWKAKKTTLHIRRPKKNRKCKI